MSWNVDGLVFNYRKRITISKSNVSSDLTNFPLLVKFSDPCLSICRDDGADIRFTSSAGTLLSKEKEYFIKPSGAWWVKVPTISSTADTDIYIYYGNVTAREQSNPQDVWDANFKAVWHGGSLVDSTGKTTLTPVSTAQYNQPDGFVNKAFSFNGSSDYLSAPDGGETDIYGANQPITISCFAKADTVTGSGSVLNTLFGKYNRQSQRAYMLAFINDGSARMACYISQDGTTGTNTAKGGTVAVTGVWKHHVGVYNDTDIRVYLNGVLDSNGASNPFAYTAGIFNSTALFTIGANFDSSGNPTSYLDGMLCEVRVSNVERSAAWNKFEYYNMASASNELSIGAEEGSITTGAEGQFKRVIGLDRTKFSADVNDYPVAIDLTGYDMSNARPDLGDVRFTTRDGTALRHRKDSSLPIFYVEADVSMSAGDPWNQTLTMNYGLPGALAPVSGDSVYLPDSVFNAVSAEGVVFLSHFEGPNGSNEFIDSGVDGKVATKYGAPILSSTQKRFGNFAGYFNGSSMIGFTSPDFSTGGDWTIEGWFRTDNASGTYQFICGESSASGAAGILIGVSWAASAKMELRLASNASSWDILSTYGTKTIASTTWYHFALVRYGTSYKLYIDGTLDISTTSALNIFKADLPFSIGASPYGTFNYPFYGYVDEVRISKGVARYTANFTPPAARFASDCFTKLLVHFDSIDVSPKTDDVSTWTGTNHAIAYGQYKFSSASVYLNGTSAYLTLPTNDDLNFYAGDFTIDFWWMPNSLTPTQYFMYHYQDGSNSAGFRLATGGKLDYWTYISGSYQTFHETTTAPAFVIGKWYHIAFVRSGNFGRFYVDGVGQATTATNQFSGSITALTGPAYIGCWSQGSPSYFLSAYLDEFRVSKGIARWTADFVPARAKYVADDYTKVLFHFGASSDFTNVAAYTMNGSLTIDYSSPKFYSSSMAFPGSAWLSVPDSADFSMGLADFTIEAWVKLTSTGGTNHVIGQIDSSQANGSFNIYYNGSSIVGRFWDSGGTAYAVTGTTSLAAGTWYHVALVRYGNGLKLYINGTSEGGTTDVTGVAVNDSAYQVGIGRNGEYNSNYWIGNLDEVRISKGIARYTANFTAPTSRFATDTYTKLLFHLCSPRVAEFHPVTFVSNACLSTDTAKFGLSCYKCNGTGYGEIPDSTDFNLSGVDWTIDCWFKLSSLSTYQAFFGRATTSGGCGLVVLYYPSTGKVGYALSSNGSSWDICQDIQTTTTIVVNTWYHVAFVRYGTRYSCYINGVEEAYTTSSSSVYSCTGSPFVIGGKQENNGTKVFNINGYIAELRVVKGRAVWTSAFTPPSAPYLSGSLVQPEFKKFVNIDLMEYSTDAKANEAWPLVSGGASSGKVMSVYPPLQNGSFIKATSQWSSSYNPWFATDPALSITGAWSGNAWLSANGNVTNQRFNIDLGVAKVIRSIYYVNAHDNNADTDWGAKNFILQGSNSASALSNVTYADDTGWTTIQSGLQFEQGYTQKYILISNEISYRYYSLKIADAWGVTYAMGFRRIELQESYSAGVPQFSEAVIKTQGGYSFGIMGSGTGAKIVTDPIASFNLAGMTEIIGKARGGKAGDITIGYQQGSFDPYIKFQSNFESGHGSNFDSIDSKNLLRAITTTGATLTRDWHKFGTHSLNVNSVGVSVPASTDFQFGTGDFTIDFWVCRGATSPWYHSFDMFSMISGSNYYTFGLNYNGNIYMYFRQNGGSGTFENMFVASFGENPFRIGAWTHVALVKTNGKVYVYVNGLAIQDYNNQSNRWIANTTSIGDFSGPFNIFVPHLYGGLAGYVDAFRVSKGLARWTENFVPPVMAPTVDADTVFLCNFEPCMDSGYSEKFFAIDSAAPDTPPTMAGAPALSIIQKKFGTSSLYLNGSSWLMLPNPSFIAVPYSGSTDFTIDGWFWVNDATTGNCLFWEGSTSTACGILLGVGYDSSQKVSWRVSSNGSSWDIVYQTGTTTIASQTWNHFAMVRAGTSYKLYVNGVLELSATSSSAPFTVGPFYVGKCDYTPGGFIPNLTGYVDAFRICRGYARWISNFTPDMAMPQPDPYTTHLFNFEPVPDTSRLCNKIVTFNGNCSVSQTQAKIGNTSLYFDNGTTSYATIADCTDVDFSTGGDWTIEGWIYFTELNSNYRPLFGQSTASSGVGMIACTRSDSSNRFSIWISSDGSSWNIAAGSGTALGSIAQLNTWYHLAMVRYGTRYSLYVNGVEDCYVVSASNPYHEAGRPFCIGSKNGSFSHVGYIDGFKILRGVARYTTSFTPSTTFSANALAAEATMIKTISAPEVDVWQDFKVDLASVPEVATNPFAKFSLAIPAGSESVGEFSTDINTSLLLHFNGPNNSTEFSDISGSNHRFTGAGSPYLSTSKYKFGASSVYLTGTTCYLTTTDVSDLHISNQDFTIDGWFYLDEADGTDRNIAGMGGGSGNWSSSGHEWGIYILSNQLYMNWNVGGSPFWLYQTGSLSIGNGWHHIAIVRNSGTLKFYKDGVSIGSGSMGTVDSITGGTPHFNIGASSDSGTAYVWKGWIDEFRFSIGVARWTANFTPPSSAYSTDSSTKILCHFESLDFSGSSVFNSVTFNGTSALSTTQKKFGTSALWVDNNTTACVSIPNNANNDLSTCGDWTIEGWFYFITGGSYPALFGKANGSGLGPVMLNRNPGDGLIHMYAWANTGTWDIAWGPLTSGAVSTIPMPANQWVHVAFVHYGTSYKVYMNGIQVCSVTSALNVYNHDYPLTIGNEAPGRSYHWQGYIDEFRITKGVARYTGQFVPSLRGIPFYLDDIRAVNSWVTVDNFEYATDAEAKTAWPSGVEDSYTKLLLRFNGADGDTATVDSSSYARSITLTGCALSSTQKKYGGTSLGLDGSGYITVPASSDFRALGMSDFTMEYWSYNTSAPSNMNIFGQPANAWNYKYSQITSGGDYVHRQVQHGGGGANEINLTWTAPTFPINQWVHYALVRRGSTFTLYINGVSQGDKTSSNIIDNTDFNAAGIYLFGGTGYGGDYNGYIDDFKLSIGVARYTANFTPSAPLAGLNVYSVTSSVDPNVKMLLHFNVANGSKEVFDSSGTGKITTFVGTVEISSTHKIGANSVYISNTTGSYLSIPDSDDFYFGTDPFTIDFWINFSALAVNGSYNPKIMGQFDAAGNLFQIYLADNNAIYFTWQDNGYTNRAEYQTTSGIPGIATGTWFHLAFVRNGTDFKIYVNGVSQALTVAQAIGTNSLGNISHELEIGEFSHAINSAYQLNGYIDELRISKGIARWTSNFIPQTTPYETDSYTKLLLHFDSLDSSSFYRPQKFTGSAIISTAQSKFGTASLYIPTGSHPSWLQFPASTDWNVGADDFTTELWVYPLDRNNYYSLFFVGSSIAYNIAPYWLCIWMDGLLHLYGSVSSGWDLGNVAGTHAVPLNEWSHIAVSRKGNKIRSFVNGVLDATITTTASLATSSGVFMVGGYPDNYSFAGYIDEFRHVKGVGKYTANFTPPTSSFGDDVVLAPQEGSYFMKIVADKGDSYGSQIYKTFEAPLDLSGKDFITGKIAASRAGTHFSLFYDYGAYYTVYDSYTKLMCHFNGENGATTSSDETGKHNLTFNGSVSLTTTSPKFGTACLNCAGGYINIPYSSDFDFGTGEFTLEFWVKTTSYSGYPTVIGRNGGGVPWNVYLNGSGGIYWYSNSNGALQGSTNVADGNWHHIAIVRYSSNTKIYVDGVVDATGTGWTGALDGTSSLRMGYTDANGYFIGMLDEVRISKGIARYTVAFTPPSAAFAPDVPSPYVARITKSITIVSANVWQNVDWYLGSDETKREIIRFGVVVTNADEENLIYLDFFKGQYVGVFDLDISVNDASTTEENFSYATIPALDIGAGGTIYESITKEEVCTVARSMPTTPTNSSPSNGSINQSLMATLQGSAYSHPLSVAHQRSRWQVRTSAGDYTSPVYDSGWVSGAPISHQVPAGTLLPATTYYWHVSYRDVEMAWSDWSSETSFTTNTLRISGQVTLSDTGVSGAKVYCVRQSTNTVIGTTTTDGGGNYQFSPLVYGEKYHLAVEYTSGGGVKYNALSRWSIDPIETAV